MPYDVSSLFKRMSWSTQSKAADRSSIERSTRLPQSSSLMMSEKTAVSAVSVE